LSHPVATLAAEAVDALVEAAMATSAGPVGRRVVALQIDVPESV
jgi:LacI family transcriptional regulator